MNASIYVWKHQVLMNSSSIFNEDTMVYVMPEERSIDLDAELDFEFVEFLMKKIKTSYKSSILPEAGYHKV